MLKLELPVMTKCYEQIYWMQIVTVMLVTSLYWWVYDGDWFEMLVAESLCWRLFSLCWLFSICIKLVTNILNRSPTSHTCHQTFDLQHPSPTSMVPPICINFSSFLDETVCSVQDLEEIQNPDSTDYPSFLGQNYENRDCTRVLRSNVSKSSFHPLHSL